MNARAATFSITFTEINFAPIVPITMAITVAKANPKMAETKRVKGDFSLALKATTANCVLSPSSAKNIKRNVEANNLMSSVANKLYFPKVILSIKGTLTR